MFWLLTASQAAEKREKSGPLVGSKLILGYCYRGQRELYLKFGGFTKASLKKNSVILVIKKLQERREHQRLRTYRNVLCRN
jgi:hypothetical protein